MTTRLPSMANEPAARRAAVWAQTRLGDTTNGGSNAYSSPSAGQSRSRLTTTGSPAQHTARTNTGSLVGPGASATASATSGTSTPALARNSLPSRWYEAITLTGLIRRPLLDGAENATSM